MSTDSAVALGQAEADTAATTAPITTSTSTTSMVPTAAAATASSSSTNKARANKQAKDSAISTSISPSPEVVGEIVKNLKSASQWNQGKEGRRYDKSLWDVEYCRKSAFAYDQALKALLKTANKPSQSTKSILLETATVQAAMRVLLKCKYEPQFLSDKVREWERCLGQLQQTPLTNTLSLCLLEANGKAGNLGRVLSLLQLRTDHGFAPCKHEFVWAVTAVEAANHPQIRNRNYFVSEKNQPAIDHPTRWLDAILFNMYKRKFYLTTDLAARMLECYVGGKTGKLVHHFWRVKRQGIKSLPVDERPVHTDEMPHEWFHVHIKTRADDVTAATSNDSDSPIAQDVGMSYQPIKVRIRHTGGAPPFYKVPSEAKGKAFVSHKDANKSVSKLDHESEQDYSEALAAAFAFSDSLQHGACGHPPVELDTRCYNSLVKACVKRGALWRAMHLVDTVMPAANCMPNNVTYTLLLNGLASVGDVHTAQEYCRKMLNAGLKADPFIVRAMVDCLLNVGDTAGAVTAVQDFFNQHCVLPPYTVHLRILEFCLARDLVYEAKRYVYFIQQLWYWTPNEYHSPFFVKLMQATQRNAQLQKPALQKLFAYFGESLEESDFLPPPRQK
jgi:pentatricopeptide repeat protein